MTIIVWFRQDLRRADNPALAAAAERGVVLPVHILDDGTGPETPRPLGGAARWWLHHSLAALRDDLGSLTLRRGDPGDVLESLVEETGATAVYWSRRYDPGGVARDRAVKARLQACGVAVESFPGSLLREPWTIRTQSGQPYRVFTPFRRALLASAIAEPEAAPARIALADAPLGDRLDDWRLTPRSPNWAEGWERLWRPGEAGAQARLDAFIDETLGDYAEGRDRPDRPATSRLSPHLRWGEISARQIRARLRFRADERPAEAEAVEKFLSELAWRDFSHHLLFAWPSLPERNWRPAFDAYPWRDDAGDLEAWRRGRTGYPMVDAGMRELWRTGFMHNRVRMLTASFLVKHLRLHWREGEAWFWDTLADADPANNAASWQWVAGSGADAAPYFRIFNPATQGRKFDPDGVYIRRWLPELARLDDRWIHAPHEAPAAALDAAGVALGETYPAPIVDHAAARRQALAGYEAVKSAR